jgi:sugar transferase (PEP-CTERM/EpsH1 system associated)
MNILYLAHRIPFPPNKGEKIRSFHQVQHLAQNHAIHLACFVDDREDWPHLKSLEKYCASVDVAYRNRTLATLRALRGIPGTEPLSVLAFHSRALEDKILRRLQTANIDVVLAFSSVMAHYVGHDLSIPKVMDFVDVDSEKWRVYAEHHRFPLSWLYRLEGERLGRQEEQVANSFDHSLLVSEAEAQLLQRRVGARPITVIPNGVDLKYFAPLGGQAGDASTPIMVFTGAMDYFPNADAVSWFCQRIFPEIKKSLPGAQFHIVGRNPTRAVRRLARIPDVMVTGSVPDIRPYLAQAAVAVAPLRIARGVQNKILEAMAMGLPVVCSSEC